MFKGRVLLRTTLCAFSSFGKGKIIAHNLGTKLGLISHIYFGIFCTGCGEIKVMNKMQSTNKAPPAGRLTAT